MNNIFTQRILFWLILLIFIVAMSMYGIFNLSVKKELISPLSTIQTENSLRNAVENALNGAKGTYGISIKNLKTGEAYSQNDHKAFETGSLYKLWIMVTAFKQIQEGKLTTEEVLSEDVNTLGIVTMIVDDALNQMITISHNPAALLLTKKIKLSTVAIFLKENEFKESSLGISGGSPKSTSSDIALFYEKLYTGKFANKEYTDKMINILKNQKLKNGLPKYLPDESKTANKTGDIGWFKHDGGIVFTDQGDYIIVIMSESNYPQGAQERIALVSKAVFNYFNN